MGQEYQNSTNETNNRNCKEQVGENKVICALSGGVDSSVVAQLLNLAIGKKLYCIFVNTGLLRKMRKSKL